MRVLFLTIALLAVGLALVGTVAAAGALSFAPPVSYPANMSPSGVAVGDINADGKPDLAVVNAGSGDASVLLGNGDGTFQASVNSDVGAEPPIAVAIGDLNGDGKLDLAAAIAGQIIPPSFVSVLLGNGDGSFQAPTLYPALQSPRDVKIADLNADGKPDLALAGLGVNTEGIVSVLLGNGDGTFQPRINYVPKPAALQGTGLAVGDLNGDGKLDLAVSDRSQDVAWVVLGNGDGTFQAPTDYPAHVFPNSIAIGDVNGDSNLDLAVANEASSDVSVLLGNGDGSFQATTNYAAGIAPWKMAAGDLNGDGKLDFAFTFSFPDPDVNEVSVVLGNGDGTFQPPALFAAGPNPFGITVGDLSGDGKLDLAVTNAPDKVSVLLNTTPTVQYTFLGFSPPIPNSRWQAGRTIPVKFVVGDADGVRLSDTTAQSNADSCQAKVSLTGPDPSTTTVLGPICASYDATAHRFTASLNTSPSLSPGTYHVTAQIYDTAQPPSISTTGTEAITIKK